MSLKWKKRENFLDSDWQSLDELNRKIHLESFYYRDAPPPLEKLKADWGVSLIAVEIKSFLLYQDDLAIAYVHQWTEAKHSKNYEQKKHLFCDDLKILESEVDEQKMADIFVYLYNEFCKAEKSVWQLVLNQRKAQLYFEDRPEFVLADSLS